MSPWDYPDLCLAAEGAVVIAANCDLHDYSWSFSFGNDPNSLDNHEREEGNDDDDGDDDDDDGDDGDDGDGDDGGDDDIVGHDGGHEGGTCTTEMTTTSTSMQSGSTTPMIDPSIVKDCRNIDPTAYAQAQAYDSTATRVFT